MLHRELRTVTLLAALVSLISCGNGAGEPVAAATGAAPAPIDAKIVPPMEIGMNLSPAGPFFPAPMTANLIAAHGSLWLVGNNGWDFESKLIKRDAGGHPVDMAKGTQIIVAVRPEIRDSHYRDVDCSLSPGWSVQAMFSARKNGGDEKFRIVSAGQPKIPGDYGVKLLLTAKENGASLLQADCREQGVAPDATIDPDAISDARPFKVIRFMDWMATNEGEPRTWADRSKPTDFNQTTGKGIAVEYMVDLANRVQADPWFTMPMNADDAYYRNFAIYVRDHLAPERKAYVELSNEVWNTIFKAAQEATAKGMAAYPGEKDSKANDYYYADRVRAVMAIWSEVFAGRKDRLVRVISSQAVWPERAENILGHKETWRSGDMYATAPYFGSNGFDINTQDPKARIEALFAKGPQAVDDQINFALRAKAIAARYGLRFGTYEGGPGYSSESPEMQEQLNRLNRDPRIYDLYSLFLKRWAERVGGLYMAYNSVGEFGQYGAWGHKEFRDATPAESPKWRALTDFIASHPSAGNAAR
ncbi:hypothetical protein [Sphingomonas sp.]|uniref:hypothetical protein n=1 Tax=Sphingomonas sp. TaxID=28214 RepID=UPI000DB09B19|nr:hypothetical protein [Sphingomonas sp.]PZU09172.1 MAG: hypothetical protein DI605_10410 [Sphingomonas sp.]